MLSLVRESRALSTSIKGNEEEFKCYRVIATVVNGIPVVSSFMAMLDILEQSKVVDVPDKTVWSRAQACLINQPNFRFQLHLLLAM